MSLSRSPKQYLGVRALLPPDLQSAARDPTSSDKAYVKGTLWLNTLVPASFMWPGSGNWIPLGSISAPAVATLTGNSGGAISPALGNINIVGAGGTLVAGAGSTLTITASPQTFTWNDDVASTTMAVNNGYIVKTGAKVYALPAVAAVGDEIEVVIQSGTSWQITMAGTQTIFFGTSFTSAGGTLTSSAIGDSVWLVCMTANTTWRAIQFVGTPTPT